VTSNLPALFDYAAWADARALGAIEGLDAASAERAQAVRLYAHLAGAEHVWLARLEARIPAHAVWPELSLEEATAVSTESLAALRAIAMGDRLSQQHGNTIPEHCVGYPYARGAARELSPRSDCAAHA
jgi:uncharacterized damage-inducible protein DinB